MAVEGNPDGLPVDQFVDSLVKWKIMVHEKGMNEVHIRHLPRAVNLPAINCSHFDDPIRIAKGERERRTVEINNHPGDGCINISSDTVLKTEHNTGLGITVIPEFILLEQQERADDLRDFSTAVRD
jgi:hypothetical protein